MLGSKIILTCRSLELCREMKTDIEDKVDVRGMAIIENLKDAFLLELEGTVKMHDVVRDVAVWISYPWMMDKNHLFGQGLA